MPITVTIPKRLLLGLRPFTSKDPSRDVLMNIAVEVSSSKVALVATDTHAMAIVEARVGEKMWSTSVRRPPLKYCSEEVIGRFLVEGATDEPKTFKIPIYEIRPILSHGLKDDDVVVTFTDDEKLIVSSGGLTQAVTPTDGKFFPVWRRVADTLPEPSARESISFDAALMKKVCDAAKVLKTDTYVQTETRVNCTFSTVGTDPEKMSPGPMVARLEGIAYFRESRLLFGKPGRTTGWETKRRSTSSTRRRTSTWRRRSVSFAVTSNRTIGGVRTSRSSSVRVVHSRVAGKDIRDYE